MLLKYKRSSLSEVIKNPEVLKNFKLPSNKNVEKVYGEIFLYVFTKEIFVYYRNLALDVNQFIKDINNIKVNDGNYKLNMSHILSPFEIRTIDNYNDIKYMISTAESFFNALDRESRYPPTISSYWIEKKDTIDINLKEKLEKSSKQIKEISKQFLDKHMNTNDFMDLKWKELGDKYNISKDTIHEVMAWIYQYTQKASQIIPETGYDLVELLKLLTIDKNNIPDIIYRGGYLPKTILDFTKVKSGQDIKNPFRRRQSSWSTDKLVAESFANSYPDDFETGDGYCYVFSCKPNYDNMIADFINMHFTGYTHQKEIIMSKSLDRIKIEQMFDPEDPNKPGAYRTQFQDFKDYFKSLN